jgi:hypothetical protein
VIACRRLRSGYRAKPFPPPTSELGVERIVFVPIRASTTRSSAVVTELKKEIALDAVKQRPTQELKSTRETSDLQP